MNESDHKRDLKKAWKEQERQRLLASVPIPLTELHKLFDHLDRKDAPACDHTLRDTLTFLRSRGLEEPAIVAWLNEHGGFCDCEVLANVENTFGPFL